MYNQEGAQQSLLQIREIKTGTLTLTGVLRQKPGADNNDCYNMLHRIIQTAVLIRNNVVHFVEKIILKS